MTEYFHLLTNAAHWGFELTTDIVLGFLLYPFAKWGWNRALKNHDKAHHSEKE